MESSGSAGIVTSRACHDGRVSLPCMVLDACIEDVGAAYRAAVVHLDVAHSSHGMIHHAHFWMEVHVLLPSGCHRLSHERKIWNVQLSHLMSKFPRKCKSR